MTRERPCPRVLMATLFDWTAPLHLGSHNLAAAFVRRGWDVAFVSTAVSPVQVLRDRDEFKRKAKTARDGGRRHLDRRLWAYTPFALLTPHNVPLLRSRWLHRNWQRLTVPNAEGRVRDHGFGQVDLLYVDTPLQSFWLDAVGHAASVARITDRNTGYVGSASTLHEMERDLVRSVDLVVHSASDLGGDLQAHGARRTLHLPNGVDYRHFAEADPAPPPEYANLPHPIAVYVGSLDEWFDTDGMRAAAGALPDVSFVIIGPAAGSADLGAGLFNVHMLGPRPFGEVPAYLRHADLGLLPRNTRTRAELVHSMHPLKLYEYMAAGLPVVATRTREVESMATPAVLYDDDRSFIEAIRHVLVDPPDPKHGDRLARAADWDERLGTLLSAVDGLGA